MKPRTTHRGIRLTDDDIAFLDGYLSAFDEFSDGAWQWACESAIATCDRFKGRGDAYDIWLAWCMSKADA